MPHRNRRAVRAGLRLWRRRGGRRMLAAEHEVQAGRITNVVLAVVAGTAEIANSGVVVIDRSWPEGEPARNFEIDTPTHGHGELCLANSQPSANLVIDRQWQERRPFGYEAIDRCARRIVNAAEYSLDVWLETPLSQRKTRPGHEKQLCVVNAQS